MSDTTFRALMVWAVAAIGMRVFRLPVQGPIAILMEWLDFATFCAFFGVMIFVLVRL